MFFFSHSDSYDDFPCLYKEKVLLLLLVTFRSLALFRTLFLLWLKILFPLQQRSQLIFIYAWEITVTFGKVSSPSSEVYIITPRLRFHHRVGLLSRSSLRILVYLTEWQSFDLAVRPTVRLPDGLCLTNRLSMKFKIQ